MPEDTAMRFIALFDIMGFKDLVYRNLHEDVLKTIAKVSDFKLSSDASNSTRLIKPIIFSDTILFVTDGESDSDFCKLIDTCDLFLGTMLESNVPVKGAISHGLFTASVERSVFVGRPLIDAFLLAEDLKYYGAVFHHTTEIHLNRLKGPLSTRIGRKKIPMKDGPVEHAYLNLSGERVRAFLHSGFESNLKRFYETVSGPVRKYVDNTIDVYREETAQGVVANTGVSDTH